MKILKKLIKKPEGNIWKRAFIYLVFLKWFGVTAVVSLMMFQIGLITPEVDITETISNSADKIALIYETVMTKMFEIGQQVATNNPILSKILFFGLSHVVFIFYIGLTILILDVIRHFVWWLKSRKKNESI